MTYNPNVPASGQSLGETQSPIQTNFSVINTAFSVNHGDLSDADQGKHKFLQLPEQGSAPATATNEGGLYTKVNDSVTTLYFRQESNGTEVQLTTSQTPTKATDGATFLPGGLLLQWGQVNSPGSSGAVSFTETFGAAPYSLSVTLERSSGTQTVTISSSTIPTTTGFNYLSSSSGSSKLYWMAIGPAS